MEHGLEGTICSRAWTFTEEHKGICGPPDHDLAQLTKEHLES